MKFFWDREEDGRLPGMSRRRFVFLGLGAGVAALVLPHLPELVVPTTIPPGGLFRTGSFFTVEGAQDFPLYGSDGAPTHKAIRYRPIGKGQEDGEWTLLAVTSS